MISSGSEKVSSVVQETVIYAGFAVVMRDERAVGRLATVKQRTVLFATRRLVVVCDIKFALVLRI